MRSSVNCARWSDAAMVTSLRLPRQTRNGQDDPPAQGSIRVTVPTSKMKEVHAETSCWLKGITFASSRGITYRALFHSRCCMPICSQIRVSIFKFDLVTGMRTDSPDNDSAFSDTVSMLSSESSASSSGSGHKPPQTAMHTAPQQQPHQLVGTSPFRRVSTATESR